MRSVRKPVIEGAFGRLFGSSVAKVLDVLILHRGHDLSLGELAEYAGVSRKSLSQSVLPTLFKSNLIKQTRMIGHAKMVTLDLSGNPGNALADHLIACEFELSLRQADELAKKKS